MLLGAAPVGAAAVDLGNNGSAAYDEKGNLTIGNQALAEGDKNKGEHNTAIGTNTDTLRNVTNGDTTTKGQPLDTDANTKLVDGEGKAQSLDLSTESGGSTAVGYQSRAEGDNSTAIGNKAQITNKPVTYYADADGNKTMSVDDAAWYKDANGNLTKVPKVFRDGDGNKTDVAQYVHTYTEKDPDTGEEVSKKEITSDASKTDKDADGNPVYNYQKSDNTADLYSVTLYQPADNSIAAGTNVTANGSNAVAVGYSSTADNSAVAMGDKATATEYAVAIGKDATASVEGAIALGKGSQGNRAGGVTGWDPKTGTTSINSSLEWKSTEGALSVGSGSASRQITGVAAGSEDSDAVNLAQLKKAMTHYYSVKTTEETDQARNNNYLNDGATGNNALAAGVSAVASGDSATAVGNQTYASGANSSAYGYRSVASGANSLAIGSGTSAQQEGSIAVGGHAQGYYAVQVGTGSTAQSAYSVAVGGHAKGEHSVEVGYGSTAQGSYSTSVGGHAIGNNSIAIGSENVWGIYSNPASAGGDNSIAIGGHTNSANDIAIGAGSATSGGQAVTVGGSATGHQSVSVGNSANATATQATAIGYGSSATWSQSTAVGGHATGSSATAVGQGSNATNSSATAVGNGAEAGGQYSTALGNSTSAGGTYTTAIGGANASGTNVTAIGKDSSAGGSWGSSISNSTAIGGAHISSSNATAIGSNATVNGQYGVALGDNSNVSEKSTGVGAATKASNTGTAVGYGAQAYGTQSAAVGAGSMATGTNSVSLGGGGAWGDYSIALGSGSGTAANAIALGQNSGAWGKDAIAIGTGSNAWRANSIVLGKNSKSGADKNIEGYDPRTGVASVDASVAWYSTDEAVSIGRAEEKDADGNVTTAAITRQLSNVAAGTLDTDAVNVAQLKAAAQKINMHDYSVYSPDTETDTNYTNGGAVAKNSMAAGVSASTSQNAENAVAIGYKAKADGVGATVIGQYGTATGRYALAFGGQQTDTTAAAANNVASGDNAVSFGERTAASGNNSTAFGWQTKATEKRATAFGERTTASGANSTAFGQLATASGQNSTAFGNEAVANNYGSTAFGNRTEALGEYSTAFGNSTVAAGMNTTAFGTDNVAGAVLDDNGAYTNIIYKTNEKGRVERDTNGNPIELSREKMDARGNLAYLDGSGNTKSVPYTVAGGETHSYVLLQGEDGNTYIRDYQGNIRSATIGDDGKVTVGDTALTDVTLKKATVGANGYHILSYANATVWGENSIASGEASTAFGVNSKAAAKNSLAALGGTVDETAINSAAIGNGAQAKLADTVALGSRSVADRVSGAKGYDAAAGKETTETSAAWVSNANAIAVGNGSTLTRQITGVAAGSQDTDAVNLAQLKKVGEAHTTVSVGGQKAQENGKEVEGGNLVLTRTQDEKTKAYNYDVKLGNDINIGEKGADGKDGVDGKIGVNGKDGSAVVINGKDGSIGLNGKDGANGLTIKGAAGAAGIDGTDGHDGKDGMTRIVYEDHNKGTHEIATLDDGLKFGGDFGNASAVKLDKQVNVKGNAKKEEDLTDGNIGVVSSQDGENGQLLVKLNKDLDLTDKGSVKMGNTTIDNGGVTIKNSAADKTKNVSLTNAGLDNGDNKITNVADGEISDTSTDAINGSQLYEVQQKAEAHTKVTVEDGTDAGTTAKDGTRTYTGTNLKLNQLTDENGATVYDLKLADAVTIGGKDGTNGVDGHIGVRGKDGEKEADGRDAVSIDGKDGNEGHIGLKGKDGEKGKDGQNAYSDITTHFGPATLNPDKNVKITEDDGEKDAATRIHYVDQNNEEHEVATMDDGLTFVGDDGQQIKKYLNEELTIKGGAKTADENGHSLLTDGNIGVVKDNDGNMVVKLAKEVKDLSSITIKNTSTAEGTKDVTIDGTGIHAGGKKVTNVADGEISDTSTDAVNGSQLNAVKTLAEQHTTVEAGPSGNVTVTPGTNADGSKKYTVDLAKNVTFGDTAKGDKTVAISGTNGTITAGTGDNKVTVDGSKGQIVAGGDNGVKIGKIADGDSSLTIYDKDGNKTDKTADGGKFVANLDNKTWNKDGSYVSGRAATEDQLHQVESNVNKQITDVNTKIDDVDKHHTEVTVNGGTAAKTDGSYTDGNLQLAQKTGTNGQKIYDLKLSDTLNLGKAGENGKDGVNGSIGLTGADGKSGIGLNGKDGISVIGADGQNGVSITGSNGKDGKDGIDGKIAIGTPGKDGQSGKDAVSLSGQNGEGHIGLTGAAGKDGKNAMADIHVVSGQVGVDGTDGHGGKDGMDRVVYEDHNHVTHEAATMDDGMKFVGDDKNAISKKLNETLSITGGQTDSSKLSTGANIGVINEKNGLKIELAKDITGINSVTFNSTTDNSKHVTISGDKVDVGGNQIHNVAPGTAPTDAVNVSQLTATNQNVANLGGEVNKLGTRVNRVGANAAALAALHPLDFDPDDKWDFTAGYGNYKNANAAAIGAYYRPNEDTMFSVGGSFGGGENMVNAGISVKLGQGNHVSTSRVAMAKEIKDLRKDVADLKAVVNSQSVLIDKLTGVNAGQLSGGNELFPDVPANHWAYEYVTKLKQAGILTGYPDGTFSGDRMMTRYEFAAIVYRAIMAGAASNPSLNQNGTLDKLAKEFSGEMKYIRIDTIRKDKNDKPIIQRVRVIKDKEK